VSEAKDEEQHLIELLEMLKADYLRAAQPYVERLSRIRAIRDRPSIVVSAEHWNALNIGKKP